MPGTGVAGWSALWTDWYAGHLAEEWELMYRRGLSRGRIADLVRVPVPVPVRTVAYHLATARTRDPGLEDEHEAAAVNPGSWPFGTTDRCGPSRRNLCAGTSGKTGGKRNDALRLVQPL